MYKRLYEDCYIYSLFFLKKVTHSSPTSLHSVHTLFPTCSTPLKKKRTGFAMTCMCLCRNTCNLPDYRRRQCRNCSVLGTWEPTARKKGWRARRSWLLQRISEAWRSRCSLVPCSVAARLWESGLAFPRKKEVHSALERIRCLGIEFLIFSKQQNRFKKPDLFFAITRFDKNSQKSHGQFSPHYSLAFSNFKRPISLLPLLSRPFS